MPLVTRTRYNAKGEPFETVDPKGIVTRTEFDALGRRVRTIQNYLPGSTAPDANITTEFTYKAGHLSAVTAINPATGNQTTRYEYGVSPATGSLVSRNDLLREIIYPDGGLNTVKHRYNRQGELIGMTDQNGTVHAYERDKLGRMTADEVTSLGTGIDGTVRKLGTTYNARGLVEKLTSYGPTGNVVNEVKNTYNGLNQLTEQAQSHSGAVTGGTPKVEYGYDHSASGGVFTKGARPTDITYPSGRQIDFDYGSVGGSGDKLARVEALVDGAQTLVAYSYLGVGTFVVTDYIEPELKLDYTAAASGDAKYPGFDQYNRVVQHHWTAYGASPGLRDGFDYGYDANSNRLWRANLTAQALDKPFDELYQYDSLNRLVDFQRGTLNAEHTAILGTPTKEQTWNLDPTGNWSQFTSADDGVLETDQTRISNPANEITEISSWFPPGYDHAGNMMRIPKPAAPQEGFLATWDAWNRLVKLVDAGTSDTVQENAYDAQTWRTVQKDYDADERHCYYNKWWQIIEERLVAATTPEQQFIWGLRYIDDLALRDRDTDVDGDMDERVYSLQDSNWNVAALTDSLGSVLQRFAYSPYGLPEFLEEDFVNNDNQFHWTTLFTGQRYDEGTGLYLYRYRYLHSQVGTFTSRDRAGYIDGPSLYEYCLSSPIGQRDPFGLFCCTISLAQIIEEHFKELQTRVGAAQQRLLDRIDFFGVLRRIREGAQRLGEAAAQFRDAITSILSDLLPAGLVREAGNISATLTELIEKQTAANLCVDTEGINIKGERCCCRITGKPRDPEIKGVIPRVGAVGVAVTYKDTHVEKCCEVNAGSHSDFSVTRVNIKITIGAGGIVGGALDIPYLIEGKTLFLIVCEPKVVKLFQGEKLVDVEAKDGGPCIPLKEGTKLRCGQA